MRVIMALIIGIVLGLAGQAYAGGCCGSGGSCGGGCSCNMSQAAPQQLAAAENTENNESAVSTESTEQTTAKKELVEVGNKICPVSGEKIPEAGEKSDMGEVIKYEYNGKIYNLCCPMCIKDFKKNPEKYSKIAEDEVAKEKAEGQTHEK